jgi:hypothetical protein
VQRQHGLDYTRAAANGYWWRFSSDVNIPDPDGRLIEIPTYTEMVAPWTMLTRKRLGFRKQGGGTGTQPGSRFNRALDLARLRYPMKLDFCRMTLQELVRMIDGVMKADARNPELLRPIVAIGHAKDLVDDRTVAQFLDVLRERGIPVSSLADVYPRCAEVQPQAPLVQRSMSARHTENS